MRKAKITLNKNTILQGGAKCINPTITVTGSDSSCLLINCIEDNAGVYEIIVQIPDDCDEQCITYIIDCEDCDQCPPQIFTRCLCDTNGDCPNCFECVDGFCQPTPCPELCDPATGDCVECIDNGDCPCDQICTNGGCGCPPGFVPNDKGCCVECLSNNDCEGCDICVGGNCTPRVCSGILNPVTCDCVECIENGDCEDDECCIGGRCRCCPGFFRNPEGDCVPLPDCVTGEDCPECFTCVAGDCVPIVCPPGRICVDGECRIACDCANPQCPQGSVCIPDFKGDCFCSPCTGPCTGANDCGEGCDCVNGQCTPKKCIGPCVNTGDCGPGCGCQNGQCVDCSTLTCNQCALVNGCDCIGDVCVDSPCDSACTSPLDCGQGCGCQNNNCVACESVSCTTNANCPQGCVCVNGTCTPNPCINTFCSSPADCGPGCGCVNGQCVPCSTLNCNTNQCDNAPGCECVGNVCQDDNEDDCDDTIKLEKIDASCDLLAEQVTEECCQCENIENRINTTYTVTGGTVEYAVQINLLKNNVALNVAPNGADDLPVTGVYRATLEQTYREVYPVGNPLAGQVVPGGNVLNLSTNKTASVVGLTTATITFTNTDVSLAAPTTTVIIGGISYRIASRRVRVQTTTNLAPNNECRYNLPSTLVLNVPSFTNPPATGTTVNFNTFMNRLVICRQPKFTLYKADTAAGLGNPANIFETYFPTRINATTYRKLYTNYQPLEYGKYYRLESDCGCESVVDYSCSGGAASPLVFCNPTNFNFEVDDCGQTLRILGDVNVTCDVYLAVGAAKPVYQLLINGVVVATRTLGTAPATATAILIDQEEFIFGAPIKTVELRIVGDECQECNVVKPSTVTGLDVTLTATPSCGVTNTFNIGINGGTGPFDYTIDLGINEVAADTISGSTSIVLPNVSGTYVLEVTDDDGCIATATLIYNANLGNITGLVTATPSCNGTAGTISVTNNSTSNLNVTTNPGLIGSTVAPGATVVVASGLTSGSYIVNAVVVGNPECSVLIPVVVNCCQSTPLNNIGVSYSCATGLSVTNIPGGAVLTLGGNPIVQGQTLPNGSYTIVATLNGCTRNINFNVACIAPPNACDNNCFNIYLYAKGEPLALRINGVNYPLTGIQTGASCVTVTGNAGFDSNLVNSILNALYSAGECNTPVVVIAPQGVDYNTITNPNNCLSTVPSDPTDCFWVNVGILNTGLNITHSVVGNAACLVPSVACNLV